MDDAVLPCYESKGAKYRLAVLRGSELARLLPLFADAFGSGRFTAEWLERKYACEYDGLRAFCCVAFGEDGEPAGSVGVLPWAMRYADRIEGAGQMVDVATGSAHRGRGLFVRLGELALQVCEDADVSFLFGFPNEAAYPIWMNKLGYEHIHDLLEHRLQVRTIWAERVAQRVSPLRSLYHRYVDRTLSARAADERALENSLLRDGFAGIERDHSFFEYKFRFAGSRILSLDGGRAWLNVQRGLFIGDLEASSDSDLARTIRELKRVARRLGMHQIVFHASTETRFSGSLPGFRSSPGMPVIYRNLRSQIPSARLRFTFGDFDNF
jgi:hypothetical protein